MKRDNYRTPQVEESGRLVTEAGKRAFAVLFALLATSVLSICDSLEAVRSYFGGLKLSYGAAYICILKLPLLIVTSCSFPLRTVAWCPRLSAGKRIFYMDTSNCFAETDVFNTSIN